MLREPAGCASSLTQFFSDFSHCSTSGRSQGQCGAWGGVVDSSPSPAAGGDGAEPEHWVSWAAERHEHVRSRLSPLLPGISSCSQGARKPSPPSSWVGQDGAGRRELLMSFEWPSARASRVTVAVPETFPKLGITGCKSLCYHCVCSPDDPPGPLITLSPPQSYLRR